MNLLENFVGIILVAWLCAGVAIMVCEIPLTLGILAVAAVLWTFIIRHRSS